MSEQRGGGSHLGALGSGHILEHLQQDSGQRCRSNCNAVFLGDLFRPKSMHELAGSPALLQVVHHWEKFKEIFRHLDPAGSSAIKVTDMKVSKGTSLYIIFKEPEK